MPFIQNPYDVLLEAAKSDLSNNTEQVLRENEIRTKLNSVEEITESVGLSPEMIPVISIGEDYLVEMNYIGGFMQSCNIKSVAEALDIIAEANKLPEKSVGLLIESDDYVEAMLEKASKTTNPKVKDKIMKKVKKSTDLTDKLQDDGYKVKKKKKDKKKAAAKPKSKKATKNDDM